MRSLIHYLNKYPVYRWLYIILTIAGVSMRIHQHFCGRPLWEDEAHISLNFVYFGYKDLLEPLAHWQTAPILFLYGVETFTRIFGFSEIALRGFPFIVSLLVYPLFYPFVRDMTKSRFVAILSFTLVTFNAVIIQYSSEVKPYILELDAYILLGFLIVSSNRFVIKYRHALLLFAGAFAVLSANAANVVLICIMAYMIFSWHYSRDKAKRGNLSVSLPVKDLVLMSLWVLVIAFNFYLFIYDHPYSEGMRLYWQHAFLPVKSDSEVVVAYMDKIYGQVFYSMLMFREENIFDYTLLVIYTIGIIFLIVKRQWRVAIVVILPLLLHFMLSALQYYPIYYRFILYLLPALMILLSIGAKAISKMLNKLNFIAAAIFVGFVLFFTLQLSLSSFPLVERNIKPVLNYINNKPLDMQLYITTPATLYEFYNRTGKADNDNIHNIEWNVQPDKYYEILSEQNSDYLLLCSEDGYADGYGNVINDLKEQGLVADELTYGTYTILHVRPL